MVKRTASVSEMIETVGNVPLRTKMAELYVINCPWIFDGGFGTSPFDVQISQEVNLRIYRMALTEMASVEGWDDV